MTPTISCRSRPRTSHTVTGGNIVVLTHGKGMIQSFNVDRDGTIHFTRDGNGYRLDPQTRALSDEDF